MRGCPTSTFWPLSQIWSSVKSLLMTAVVVVFNWKRKHRVTSHAGAHQALLSAQEAFFAMAHHNCPFRDRDSLAGEQEVETKAGGVRRWVGSVPGLVSLLISHSRATGPGMKVKGQGRGSQGCGHVHACE